MTEGKMKGGKHADTGGTRAEDIMIDLSSARPYLCTAGRGTVA